MPLRLPKPLLTTLMAAGLVFAGLLAVAALTRSDSSAPAATRGEEARLAAVLDDDPGNPRALARLAGVRLVAARDSGDVAFYDDAEDAALRALESDPGNVDALDALGTVALNRHEFAGALEWSERSVAVEPGRLTPLSIRGDALVELGRYAEGFAVVRRRLSLKPDLSSYGRASYWRELVGDRAGAITMMRLAADAGVAGGEPRAWALTQLGLLRLRGGDVAGAERDVRRALTERPGNLDATAGLARVQTATGDLAGAAGSWERVSAALPHPELLIALAEVERARGRTEAAAAAMARYDEARAAAGPAGRLDMDAILAEADVRVPDARTVADARAARAARPSITGDQTLGWVLTRAGECEEGLRYARRSLRLGTQDAMLHFRAGMAAACAGERAEARELLASALALEPGFSLRWAPVAERELGLLEG
jgi:tetratricopeptide (TPR) repeat protein